MRIYMWKYSLLYQRHYDNDFNLLLASIYNKITTYNVSNKMSIPTNTTLNDSFSQNEYTQHPLLNTNSLQNADTLHSI